MKLRKYALALVLAVLCLVVMPKEVMAAEASGSCGSNATWSYNNGTLTIRGKGVVDDNPWMDSYKKSITNVVIEDGITELDHAWMFDHCDNMVSLQLPNTLTKIGRYTFIYCEGLKSVTLPSSLTFLGDQAFAGCVSLTEITIPKSVTECGGACFRDSGVKKATFEPGTTVVLDNIFRGCGALETVDIPSSVTKIDSFAFDGCTNLKSITFPKGLTYIGDQTFSKCESLTEATIPKGVTECGGHCFSGSGLKTVTLEDGLTVVPAFMFAKSEKLTTIYFPQSIKKIEYDAFSGCTSLTEVTLPYYVEKIENMAFGSCTNLKELTIYQNATDVSSLMLYKVTGTTICGKKNSAAHKFAKKEGFAFKACKVPALKGITYTKGNLKYQVVTDYIDGKGTVMVTGMKKNASSVTIPKTVKLESYNYKVVKLNSNAFKNKSKLKKITIKSTYLTSVGKNALKGINKKATIKVPKAKYAKYKKLFNSKTGYKKTMKVSK